MQSAQRLRTRPGIAPTPTQHHRQWTRSQTARYLVVLPAVMAILWMAGMLSTPQASAATKVIRNIRAALAMYESDHGRFQRRVGGVDSTDVGSFQDTGIADRYSLLVEPPDSPQARVDAIAAVDGFDINQAITRASTTGDHTNSQFFLEFGVSDPLDYTFSGAFSSSSSNPTPGTFHVMLMNVDSGQTLFNYLVQGIPSNFSDSISDTNSTGGLSGTFLPDVTYRLTVLSDLGDPDLSEDASVSSSAHVFVAFPVPEPGTLTLLGVGIAVLTGRGRRRSQVAPPVPSQ